MSQADRGRLQVNGGTGKSCQDPATSSGIHRHTSHHRRSHPDTGKTTLTEKLLLFGGAIQMAGTVKGRKAARHATSDRMALEQQRGIQFQRVRTQSWRHGYG